MLPITLSSDFVTVHHGITTKDFFQFLLFVIGCSIATIDLETSCVIESSFGGAILSKIVTIKLTSAQLNNLGEKMFWFLPIIFCVWERSQGERFPKREINVYFRSFPAHNPEKLSHS